MTREMLVMALAIAGVMGAWLTSLYLLSGLAQSLRDVQLTGRKIHVLVNNAMRMALADRLMLSQNQLTLTRRVYSMTHTDEDAEIARLAEVAVQTAQRVYDEHMGQQALVDQME